MKNIWKKLTSFVNRFHKNKFFIAFLILFTTAITVFNYEELVKPILIYPTEEYNELETIVSNHFEKIRYGIIEDLPDDIDYNFEINNNRITGKYSTINKTTNLRLLSIEAKYIPNNEIELTRNYTEENYKNNLRLEWILLGIIISLCVWFIFSAFCYIIRFINWIISKLFGKENNVEKNEKKELNTLEKASEVLKKLDTE